MAEIFSNITQCNLSLKWSKLSIKVIEYRSKLNITVLNSKELPHSLGFQYTDVVRRLVIVKDNLSAW